MENILSQLFHQKIWGSTSCIFQNDLLGVYLLKIKKGGVCSYHYHKEKHNTFFVLLGKIKLTTDLYGEFEVLSCQQYTIEPGVKHQFEGLVDSEVIEIEYVKSTKYNLNDIIRETEGFLKEQK